MVQSGGSGKKILTMSSRNCSGEYKKLCAEIQTKAKNLTEAVLDASNFTLKSILKLKIQFLSSELTKKIL